MGLVKSILGSVAWRRERRRLVRRFRAELAEFRSLAGKAPRLPIDNGDVRPCLDDRDGAAGYDRHYFLHTAWAARVLAETSPTSHVDVSSHLTFSAVASAFVPMTLLEFAPPPTPVEGLEIQRGDVTRLPLADGSVKSLSCMHVVEHIGLGRYGDALDPEGDLKAMGELRRVLAPGGQLLLVVPVGRPRVVFNAHRVYDPGMVVEGLRPLKLSEFALIPDNHADGDLVRRADLSLGLHQSYGCGCFHFMKSSPE